MADKGMLVCDKINLNSLESIEKLLNLLNTFAKDDANYHKIVVSGSCYFQLQ